MSATICFEIVDIDNLIPRAVDNEDENIKKLTPWIFQHCDTAEENCTDNWPDNEWDLRNLFDDLSSYCAEVKEYNSGSIGVENALRPSEMITLPRKTWKVPAREDSEPFIRRQGMMLRVLMKIVYFNLDARIQGPKVRFPVSILKMKYVIGGEKFLTRAEGAATIEGLPIISCTGWFEGQTWREFLEETISVMLGQLAKNIRYSSAGIQGYI
ncbi:hypothetical protein ARAM_002253 [Aspergillus rambellii]|uniref:Uncharacterized protein n=2 Tax=Aspergillus subgen. Nidulantes TaxID=2720870 RepID=A0A0F8XUX2_9EURO|nr:hypothetical protein ARAM_002253 [Aspergillus rambellii]